MPFNPLCLTQAEQRCFAGLEGFFLNYGKQKLVTLRWIPKKLQTSLHVPSMFLIRGWSQEWRIVRFKQWALQCVYTAFGIFSRISTCVPCLEDDILDAPAYPCPRQFFMSNFHCGRVFSIELAIASAIILCRLLNPKNSSWIYPSLSTKRRTSDSQFMHPCNIVTCDRACDAFLNWFSFVFLQKRKSRLAEFRKGGSDTFFPLEIIFIFITQKGGSRTPGTLPWLRPCQ